MGIQHSWLLGLGRRRDCRNHANAGSGRRVTSSSVLVRGLQSKLSAGRLPRASRSVAALRDWRYPPQPHTTPESTSRSTEGVACAEPAAAAYLSEVAAPAVTVISVPYSSGRRDYGMGRGPTVLLEQHGLAERLSGDGFDVTVDTVGIPDTLVPEIARTFELNRRLAASVRDARAEGTFPIVLSGNCNCAWARRPGPRRTGRRPCSGSTRMRISTCPTTTCRASSTLWRSPPSPVRAGRRLLRPSPASSRSRARCPAGRSTGPRRLAAAAPPAIGRRRLLGWQ